jgi:hypothetical protein
MLCAYLFKERVYPAGIIQGTVVFEKQFRSVPDGEIFTDFTADKTLGAVKAGLRILLGLLISNDSEKDLCQTQVIAKLNCSDCDKADSGIIKTPGKD